MQYSAKSPLTGAVVLFALSLVSASGKAAPILSEVRQTEATQASKATLPITVEGQLYEGTIYGDLIYEYRLSLQFASYPLLHQYARQFCTVQPGDGLKIFANRDGRLDIHLGTGKPTAVQTINYRYYDDSSRSWVSGGTACP